MNKLHLGCGPAPIEGWVNTDINPLHPGTLAMDASGPFPFPDGHFDYVFSEHFIEHLTYDASLVCLRECHRCLKPGGKIRIATPDIQAIVGLLKPHLSPLEEAYVKWASEAFVHRDLVDPTLVVNNFFRDWGHQFIWSGALLFRCLIDTGFKDIFRCRVGISPDPIFHSLEQHGKWIPEVFNTFETMVFEANR